MTNRKFLGAWASYVLTTFAGGFLWHLVLFESTYVNLRIFTRIEDPVIPLGLTAMVIQGAILAYLYPLVTRRLRPAVDGLRFGALIGLFLATSAVLAEAGKNYVASLGTWLGLEGSYYLLQFMLSGLVIGLIYGPADAAPAGDGTTGAPTRLPAIALLLLLPTFGTCTTEVPTSSTSEPPAPLGYIEDNRVVFDKSELSVINETGVLLNLVATRGHVGIRFYKDFGFGNEQRTNPWHMGFIEGVEGYQGLAILRDWLFTAALWDEDGRLLVGRLDPHPPANAPAGARFEVRGTVDEVQAAVEAPAAQTAEIFRVARGAGAGGPETVHFAVDGAGNTIIGSPSAPKALILHDIVDGTPYTLTVVNGQLAVTRVN